MEHFREGELLPFVTSLTERQAGVLSHLLGCSRCRGYGTLLAFRCDQSGRGVENHKFARRASFAIQNAPNDKGAGRGRVD